MTDQIALTPDQAAAVLGIGVTTLRNWTAEGKVPSIKIGGVRLYSVRALERWAEEASMYEETRRGQAKSLGDRELLQADWGRKVGRSRQRTPTPLRHDRAGGAADAR